ncbi:MAG: MoxR family ATPase [Rhodocyclaceae bacterium]|nr:MoxR family ATPase [Rhodocyclaceae bacterium]
MEAHATQAPEAGAALQRLIDNIESVIFGKREVVELAVIALLARGHLLLEDLPGTGKTMLARALSKSLDLDFKRVQFTPDLMPSDITGASIFNQKNGAFEFMQGPVFTHILLADEINRATPRTQSALLECMAEGQVSADGQTFALPDIFMVVATQNPIEMQGTYRLPEAQLDRFFLRASLGYPKPDVEARMLEAQVQAHPITALKPVVDRPMVLALQRAAAAVHVAPAVKRYIADVVAATRASPLLRLGASPRGSIALMRASQARALLSGREFVDPPIVKSMAAAVLAHRVLLQSDRQGSPAAAETAISEIVASVAPPLR